MPSLFFEPFGFNPNTTNTFDNVSNSLTSVNVIKLQAEDRLILHCDIVSSAGNDDILLSFNSTTNVNYSSISFINYAPEFTSKRIKSCVSLSAHFYLTDEANNAIFLNGLNITLTLMFFKHNNLTEMVRNFMRLQLLEHH
jgi:hypothetical protein